MSANVREDESRQAELNELGFNTVPIVAVGRQAVHGVDLQQVAGLIGLEYNSTPELPPSELIKRQVEFLSILDSTLDSIPETAYDQKIPGRDRTIWNLVEHMCEIAHVYQRVAEGTTTFDASAADAEVTGESTREQLHASLDGLKAKLMRETHEYEKYVDTYFGLASLHYVLERTTWHIAQHLRQLASLMRNVDKSIMQEIDTELLDQLPIPNEVWD